MNRAAPHRATQLHIRPAAAAGRFYPDHPQSLRRTIRHCLDAAPTPEGGGWRAVLAPHAGYVCSGRIAGHSFKAFAILPPAHHTVYVLGPAHFVPVSGIGLSSAEAFETPLGTVAVDEARVADLLSHSRRYRTCDDAHAPEHSIEVELPFLQEVLSDFAIVPMLFDEAAAPEQLGEDLVEIALGDPHALFVVSSDLSHYHAYDDARGRDHRLLTAIVGGDVAGVRQGEACGRWGILAIMHLAQRLKWTAVAFGYCNSGDTCGPRTSVVGYGSVGWRAGIG